MTPVGPRRLSPASGLQGPCEELRELVQGRVDLPVNPVGFDVLGAVEEEQFLVVGAGRQRERLVAHVAGCRRRILRSSEAERRSARVSRWRPRSSRDCQDLPLRQRLAARLGEKGDELLAGLPRVANAVVRDYLGLGTPPPIDSGVVNRLLTRWV